MPETRLLIYNSQFGFTANDNLKVCITNIKINMYLVFILDFI